MSSPTRWAGVPLTDRRAERRSLLVDAAFRLFRDGGEAAVSVRSVCRECGLNTRYFYESFPDVDELLGAVYDQVSRQLGEVVLRPCTRCATTCTPEPGRASRPCWDSAPPTRAVAGFCSPMRGPTRCWLADGPRVRISCCTWWCEDGWRKPRRPTHRCHGRCGDVHGCTCGTRPAVAGRSARLRPRRRRRLGDRLGARPPVAP